CLRALGAARGDGSLQGGLQAMRGELAAICGPLPAGVVLADGSGLSADNRVSPRLVAHVLHAARRESFGAMLGQALPIAGRTGTLEDRFVGSALAGRVRAKTGWIRGVSALSGYVEAGDRTWTFAILMGYDRRRSGFNKDLKRAQERIVAAIADAL
ncbi:MAG: D-alanyl-D-alanine carboxypeptidase, partial [Planctomycetes bacterium]|nr:D-alanyl-D-alanine carboxypeptidase [Planctomycetota bacterium]